MTPGLRLRRRAGAAATLAALAAALLVVVNGAPAGAAPTDPDITVTTPAEGSTVDTATVAVSGRVQAASVLASFKDVTLRVAGTSFKAPCSSSPCDFTWNPSLTTNGRYSLTVTATEQTLGLLAGASASLTRTFVVDAPPAKPALDPPKVNDARTVDLTWSRNSEPDMLYYAIFRKDPAGTTYLPVGRVDQPASGKSVTFTDTTTNLNGGDYGYQVVAVRKGGAKPETTSSPSAARTATVPAPPTTTALTVPGASAPGKGSTTTVKPGAAAGVDLSGFLSSRAQAAPTPPPTVLEPPDPGFQGTLPFAAPTPSDQVEEGDAQAVPPTTGRSTSVVSLDGARPLVPVAAGLVLLLLATHLRLLNRRLKPATAGDLPIEAAAPPLPVPPPPPAVVGDVAGPAAAEVEVAQAPPTTFYDVSDDGDWDDEWAPAGEAEPSAEPITYVDDEAGPDRSWATDADRDPSTEMATEPEPDFGLEPDFEPTAFDPAPEPDFESEPAVEPQLEPDFELEPVVPAAMAAEPDEPDVDFDELEEHFEVLEVISPTRRPLARSGHR